MQKNTKIESALKKAAMRLLRLVLIVLAALVINGFILLLSGKDPIIAYQKLFEGSLIGKWSIAKTIRWAIPVLMCGISASIAFRGDVFNIGIEGQMYVGAITATAVGIYGAALPGWILIPLCLLASMLAGGLWAAVAGYLNVRFNANIVVITLMMNHIAKLLTEWVTLYPLYTPEGAAGKATDMIAKQAELAIIVPNTQVSAALFIVLAAVILVYIWSSRTRSGYETKLMGSNPQFAKAIGIQINQKRVLLMLVSGAFAGLAGGVEILGVQHRFTVNFSTGIGFDGKVVAMLANNNPLFLPFAAIFMGAMRTGAASLEMFADIPRAISSILMGTLIMLLTIQQMPKFRRRKTVRAASSSDKPISEKNSDKQESAVSATDPL